MPKVKFIKSTDAASFKIKIDPDRPGIARVKVTLLDGTLLHLTTPRHVVEDMVRDGEKALKMAPLDSANDGETLGLNVAET